MTLYQQSNQEGAGVQRPAKHLTQLASAEGDCYRHEEDLNDREACLSDGGVENLQKSQQSYPFNNCNRNMEMAYQLQNLQPTQQPRFFKHSQSNRSLERGQGQSTRNTQAVAIAPSLSSKSPLLLQKKQQVVL